jgi:hypothetical protein
LAYLGLLTAIQHTNIERCLTKPFNPLLGETFEFVNPGHHKYLAEQVSHHPPITAIAIIGDAGFTREISV